VGSFGLSDLVALKFLVSLELDALVNRTVVVFQSLSHGSQITDEEFHTVSEEACLSVYGAAHRTF